MKIIGLAAHAHPAKRIIMIRKHSHTNTALFFAKNTGKCFTCHNVSLFIDKRHNSVSARLADIGIRNGHCILFFSVLWQCQALFKCTAAGVVCTGKHQPHLSGKIRPTVFGLYLHDTVFFLFQQCHRCRQCLFLICIYICSATKYA